MSARLYKLPIGTEYALLCDDMTPTFKDLVDFVIANKGKTFVGYDHQGIVNLLYKHISDSSLYFEQDLDGKLSGMIIADFDHDNRIIYIQENLSMNLARLGRFASKARNIYPTYSIEYTKHGKYKKLNTERLYKKLI
jgi:mRNA-degrading endonuclease YafQ of YafQ-DinJ toxin-antitoxin module